MQQTPRLARALGLVKTFETFEPRAVRRPDGGWTVGYGHTRTAREGIEVSREDAEALLLYDLMQVAAVVDRDVQATLTENQREALTAFAFNVGWRDFPQTDVVARLNAGDALGAVEALERWRRVERDGERPVLDALLPRRAAEKLLYLTPPGGFPTTATPLLRPVRDEDEAPQPPAEPEPTEPAPAGLTSPGPAPPPAPLEPSTPSPASGAPEEEEGAPPPPFADEVAGDPFNMPVAANESVAFPAPRSHDAPAAPAYVPARPETEPLAGAPGRSRAQSRSGRLAAARRWAWRACGAAGAILFAAAITLILSDRPQTWTLFCGLLGVGLMTPCVYALLGRDTAGEV